MRVGEPLDLGVRSLNTFLTVCRGQRMGIFAGSGVGKSSLLSMMAKNTSADISVIGLIGNAGQANYSASKAGLIGFTKAVARELAGRGVTCNAVAPGFITTDMTDELPAAVKEAVLAKIPLGTFGETRDIAAMVALLASDDGKFITAQVIAVDGGMTM